MADTYAITTAKEKIRKKSEAFLLDIGIAGCNALTGTACFATGHYIIGSMSAGVVVIWSYLASCTHSELKTEERELSRLEQHALEAPKAVPKALKAGRQYSTSTIGKVVEPMEEKVLKI